MRLRLVIEIAPALIAVLLAWTIPRIPASVWSIPTRVLRWLAPDGKRAVLAAALLTLAVSAMLSWARPPRPQVHDEFAYLLAADTFAHGRLTNPTHPMWEHFESFHIIQTPSYQSKYPPAQSLWMAAGQVLTASPIVGVWLSMAAAAAALCWMLLAWLPPRWALCGGLLPAVRFGTTPFWDTIWFGYWSASYWGGAVALLGAALLFGALPRLMRGIRARDGAAAGAGLILLANSRPYEGALAGLTAGAVFGGWLITHRAAWKPFTVRAVPVAACVFGAGVVAMGYYNYSNTGDPLRSPYMIYTEQYQSVPLFIFSPPKPEKTYRHEAFRDFNRGYMLDAYNNKREGFGLGETDFHDVSVFFLGYSLVPALFFLPWRRWNGWFTFALGMIVLLVLANKFVATSRLHFHYLAPAVPWILFLAIAGLRRARAFRWRGRRLGRAFAEALLASCLLSLLAGSVVRAFYLPRGVSWVSEYRPEVERQLLSIEKKDLVIVRYTPDHGPHNEWVYNDADLDQAPIVWARDMGPEENADLLNYYEDRQAWILHADQDPPKLEPVNSH